MSELSAICDHCVHKNLFTQAESDFDAQPSLTVTASAQTSEGQQVQYHVSRDIPADERAGMIKNPANVIREVEQGLETKPCDFILTGHCRAAAIVIEHTLRQPIK